MAGIVLYILQTFPVSVSIVSIGCVLLAACPHKASNTRYSTVVCFQFLSPYTIAQRTMQHFINYLHCGVHTPKFSVSTYMYVGLLYMLCILSVVHNTNIRIYVDRNPLLYDPVQAYHPSCCPSLSCNASLSGHGGLGSRTSVFLSLHVRTYYIRTYYIDSMIRRTFCGTAHRIQPLYDSAPLGNAS